MDLSQTKLTKEEWDALEVRINGRELLILKLIFRSGKNVNEIIRNTKSLIEFIKINENIDSFHPYLFEKYFKEKCKKIQSKNKLFEYSFKTKIKNKKLKKADMFRLKNFEKKIEDKKDQLFEYVILEIIKKIIKSKDTFVYVYVLNYLLNIKVAHLNKIVEKYAREILIKYDSKDYKKYVYNYSKILAKIRNYQNLKCIQLYDHQKKVISICKRSESKLVLYEAPTGTGKTLTPIGLVRNKKVIFVCAAKHIGMQLAKACISLEIPIAVAFGCKDPSDIRLHYFAAKEKIRNRRTGGIFRVDNSVGDLVEIIISDIQSYLPSMYYMCAFNKKEDLVWYWDEPTISLDQEKHEFHDILANNWKENIIPNVILSSATLPREAELTNFIMGFNQKFPGMRVHNVVSSNYSKTIPVVNSEGYAILPHNVFDNFEEIKNSVGHIENYKTILRHFDIQKICEFIMYIHKEDLIRDAYKINNYFQDLNSISTNTLKEYYLFVVKKLKKNYGKVYRHFCEKQKKMYESCIKITTEDASTLTDGPTIFITNNVKKLALFYLKVTRISNNILDPILKTIEENRVVLNELGDVEKTESQRREKLGSKDNAKDYSKNLNSTEYKLQKEYLSKVKFLTEKIKQVQLPREYIPNTLEHQKKWQSLNENAFSSNIDDETIEKIMFCKDSSKEEKILLMMGIGVFCETNCVEYNEIMKKLAQEQKLYMIIASSDYIYGTNYQFCHGYLSKDLGDISQEKLLQSFGRVGRSNLQKTYTIRLRNNDLIRKLLIKEENKPEVRNMNQLFV